MVFKLVRTDTENPCKIPLPSGTHFIGRGKFLDCEDKRISRNHGDLSVTDNEVTLKALHQNPCFFIKKNDPETQILKQDSQITLSCGDKFGLLPDSYWYEILSSTDMDQIETPEPIQNNLINTNEDSNTENYDPNSNAEDPTKLNEELNDSESNGRESPSLISQNQQSSPDVSNSAPTIAAPENEASNSNLDTKVPIMNIPDSIEARTLKRQHSEVMVDVKKVKVETEDEKSNVLPGSSTDQQANVPQNPPSPPKRSRERCIYGASCYRRNPQHLSEFSHPRDADWGTGARGHCPWGGTCRRRDPRHWQHHDHPPGTLPPGDRPGRATKRTKATRKKKRESDNDSGSDSSPEDTQNLIVTGKRQRKPVKLSSDWNGSDDEEDKDPYQTDESDEWEPSGDILSSQTYSQDFD